MAMPIKETPILKGKDSEHFLKNIRENEGQKVPQKEYESAKRIYEAVIQKEK